MLTAYQILKQNKDYNALLKLSLRFTLNKNSLLNLRIKKASIYRYDNHGARIGFEAYCCTCKVIKSAEKFDVRKARKCGRSNICKRCDKDKRLLNADNIRNGKVK